MSSTTTPERTWLIDQYLAGRLAADQHQRVNERRQADPAFDQYVLAQWLVLDRLAQENETAIFNQGIAGLVDDLSLESGAPQEHPSGEEGLVRPLRNTHKRTPYLIGLLVACMAGVLILFSLPPTRHVGTVDVDDPDYGADASRFAVVQYSHAPGFLGKWNTQDHYKWPKDTLFLYGKTLGHPLPDSAYLEPINESGQYHLVIGKRTYLLHIGQTNLTPLTADETP